jgi:CheY-like chemotaxis protein
MVTAGGKCPILVVEDEPLVSGYICEVLETFDFTVSGCASSGPEAIALAERDRPRLAVIDILWPDDWYRRGASPPRSIRCADDISFWLLERRSYRAGAGRLTPGDAVQRALLSDRSNPSPTAVGGSELQRGQ